MLNTNYHNFSNLLKQPGFLRIGGFILALCVEVFILIMVLGGYRIFYHVPDEKQAELEIEFKAIAPLPNASLFKYSSSQKITNALVTAYYTTDANSAAIFK